MATERRMRKKWYVYAEQHGCASGEHTDRVREWRRGNETQEEKMHVHMYEQGGNRKKNKSKREHKRAEESRREHKRAKESQRELKRAKESRREQKRAKETR